MINYDLIGVVVFIALLSGFLYKKRKKVDIEKVFIPGIYFVLYRTKWGIKLMDKVAKRFPKALKYFSYISIALGFIGMAAISVILIINLYNILFVPEAASGVGLVLPIKAKGVFFVPFFYWIIAILIVATVHESFHGILSRHNKVKLKSSGFAFLSILLPILPAAFVEPDEKQMNKKPLKSRLAILSAGATSNIILGFIFLLLLIGMTPLTSALVNFNVNITDVTPGSPADAAGIGSGEIIKSLDGIRLNSTIDLVNIVSNKSPGDLLIVETGKAVYNLTLGVHPKSPNKPYMGVSLTNDRYVTRKAEAKYGKALPATILWVSGLFYFLYVLNLGIGIFNLVPVGPIDGGRMLLMVCEKYFKRGGRKIFKYTSIFFLTIILINVIAGFII